MSTPWIALFVMMWAVVLALAVLVVGVVRRVVPLLEQAPIPVNAPPVSLDGLGSGEQVPAFRAYDRNGRLVFALGMQRQVVLLTAPGCRPCEALLASLSDTAAEHLRLPLTVVTDSSVAGRALSLPDWIRLLYQEQSSISHAFRTAATPFAFLVESQRVVRARIPGSLADLAQLADDEPQVELPVGPVRQKVAREMP